MHEDFIIAKIPDKYYDKRLSQKAFANMIRKLVKEMPHLFPPKRWEKYLEPKAEKREGQENDNVN